MSSGSPFLKEREIMMYNIHTDIEGLKEYNKKNMTLSMPDLSAIK